MNLLFSLILFYILHKRHNNVKHSNNKDDFSIILIKNMFEYHHSYLF